MTSHAGGQPLQMTLKRKLVFTTIVLLVSLMLAELAVRAAVTVLRRPLVYETDVELGYRLRSDLDVCRNLYGVTWCFRTDRAGRRVVPDNPSPDDATTVVLLGDSFAFGEGVNDSETVAAHLARSGFHVINLGVQGYGTNQQLMAFRRFLENEQADYSYVSALSRYFLDQPKKNAGNGQAIVAACLAAVQAEARQAGIIPKLFFHDTRQAPVIPRLFGAFEELDLPVADLTPALLAGQRRVTGPDGRHWNALGHRIVASEILASDWNAP
ncbi:MAG: SGNH/GDSL hydrolase family protein [bacterium]